MSPEFWRSLLKLCIRHDAPPTVEAFVKNRMRRATVSRELKRWIRDERRLGMMGDGCECLAGEGPTCRAGDDAELFSDLPEDAPQSWHSREIDA